MIENKIRRSNAVDLDYENIRSAVRENMERAAQRAATAKRKLPYMRAIRAVCYTLCVCTAAVMITITAYNLEYLFSQSQNVDCGKSEYIAKDFDKFFSFATLQDPDVILRSDILKYEDNQTFKSYSEKTNSKYYIIYMGIKDGTDYIVIYDWLGEGKFEFISNLKYSYADIIKNFERQSGETISDEFLTRRSSLSSAEYGIALMFMEKEGTYTPYFEAILNNKAYIVCGEVK